MDKVLKQRLVGASILIALAVIFLPMVFDSGQNDRTQRQLTLDLPERPDNTQGEVRRLPLDPDRARETPPEAVAEPPEVAEPSEAEPRVEESVDEPEPEQGVLDEPLLEPEAESPEVDEPEPESEPEPEPEPESESESESESGADLAEAGTDGNWVVQVAVFSNQDTANRIQERLDGLGHAVSINEMERDESKLYRLLSGPYVTREGAEQAREQINATVAGIDPMVRTREDSVESEQAVDRSGYSVQVGSFASRNNAERLVGQLESKGHDAFMHSEESGGRMIWRVRVGVFDAREPAESLLAELREGAGLEGIVVTHP